MTQNILFINPVVRQEDSPRHVPYGIALLASIVTREGHQVQVFDANAWRPDDEALKQVLHAAPWDVIAVGGITTTYGYVKKTVKYVKQEAPNACLILGGGILTSMPREMMTFLPEVDLGIVGEAFVTFSDVLRKLDEGAPDWSNVPGVLWRDADGRTRMSPPRPLVQELDTLPTPAWEMFPLEEVYFPISGQLISEEAMVSKRRLDINASYGCSLICRFCWRLGITGDMQTVGTTDLDRDVTFTYDRDIRWHSPRYIVDLVKHARENSGVDFICFLDENLMTMNAFIRWKWLPEICELWIKEGLQPACIRKGIPHNPKTCDGVHWNGTSHAGLIKPDLLPLLRESGCSHLTYGLESFSPRILKNLGKKGATREQNMRAIGDALAAGIRPIPNQIMGFPDEFFDSILDSVDAWEQLGIVVKPFFATPYPGSEWYYRYKDKVLAQYDGDLEAFVLDLGDATKITAVISENFNAVELLGLRELAIKLDRKRIQEYEQVWRSTHGEPIIPDFVQEAKERRSTAPVKV